MAENNNKDDSIEDIMDKMRELMTDAETTLESICFCARESTKRAGLVYVSLILRDAAALADKVKNAD